MEDIVAKYCLGFVCIGVVCVMLLIAIFTAVVIIAQNSCKQEQEQEQKQTAQTEQPVRIALCVKRPDPSITGRLLNWFTIGKVYTIKSGHIVDDQGYEWTTFVHRIRKEPHMNTCAGYGFYIV